MRVINRSVLVVLPKQPFLDWLHRADPTSENLTLEDLRREPSVYLLPARDMESDQEKCLMRLLQDDLRGTVGWLIPGEGRVAARPEYRAVSRMV